MVSVKYLTSEIYVEKTRQSIERRQYFHHAPIAREDATSVTRDANVQRYLFIPPDTDGATRMYLVAIVRVFQAMMASSG